MLLSSTTGRIVTHYRTRLAATLIVVLASSGPHACRAADPVDTTGRQAAIARVVKLQLDTSILTPDLPVLQDTLRFVRQKNPDLGDAQWREVLNEVAYILAEGMSRPGSPMFVAYQTSLEPLSDAELARLERLLADPVYRKFAIGLVSRTGQEALMRGLIESTPWMNEAFNFVLRKHGLKEAH